MIKFIRRLQGLLEDDVPIDDPTAKEREALQRRHRKYEDELRVLRLSKERRLRGFNQ